MSTMNWQGNRIMQKVGSSREQLGSIRLEKDAKTWVLWLKDTCGVLGLSGGEIRGDEYPSEEQAKAKALDSPSAFIMHYIWIRSVTKRQVIEALEEHWDEISSELDGSSKETVLDETPTRWDKLSTLEMNKWAERLAKPLTVANALVDLIRKLWV